MRRSSSTTVPPLTTRSTILSSSSSSSTSDSSDGKSHSKGEAEKEPLPLDTITAAASTSSTDTKTECAETKASNEEEESAITMRERMRLRLEDSRTAAAAEWKEFRAHPAQTAKEGAKTVSGMLRKYGPVFIGTYGCVYFTTLGLLFSGVQSGLLDPLVLFSWLGAGADAGDSATATSTVHLVVEWMENHEFTKPYAPTIEKHPAFANLAVAWIAVKFTEPVRLAVALTLTPRVSRFLGYTKEPETEPTESDGATSEAKSGSSTTPPQ
jgi:Protein of unknown function (DUF1279)